MGGAIGRLFSYCRGQKRLLLWGGGLLLIATVGEVTGPILIKIFIDDYLTPMKLERSPLLWLTVGYLVLKLMTAFSSWLQSILFSQAAENIVVSIRTEVFTTAIQLPASYYDRAQTGQLLSRITNDTQAIVTFYQQVINTFLQHSVLLVGTLVAMALLDWQMMLICFVMLPLLILVMMIYKRLSAPIFRKVRALLGDINARVSESLQGIEVIRLMAQEQRFSSEFSELNDRHRLSRMRSIKIDGLLLRPLVDLVKIFATIGLLWLFVTPELSGGIKVGVLYAFLSYLGRMLEPVIEMMSQFSQLQQSAIASERVFALMDEAVESDSGQPLESIEGRVDFKAVSFAYQEPSWILQGVSFSLEPGKMLAIVGQTGSGKSTIISLLMGFYPFQHGEISIDHQSLGSVSSQSLRRQVGLVQQDPFIFNATLADNISLKRDGIDEAWIWRALERVQLAEYVKSLPEGLQTQMDAGGANFSAGQRQLLSFARALVTEPKLLILDEATASVDSQTEAALQRILSELRQQCTLLAIAHRLSTISDADEIILLAHGEIVERGKHLELMEREGHYANLYQMQQGLVNGGG
ncbi:ABC transporter ATP-binding protein [Dongshaea marina]|uniref:ABC transporter ATP-binding protein n=1 Tax=Dongshaea marina TaxID=2047966 RepID=UPI000D3EA46C|nr:ABC transporter transmembrane domain-containing protein [Dongshaea marina]